MRPLEEIRETAPPSDPLAGRHFGSVPGHITDAAPSAPPGHSGSAWPQFPGPQREEPGISGSRRRSQHLKKNTPAFGSRAAADELIWNCVLISTLTSVDGERRRHARLPFGNGELKRPQAQRSSRGFSLPPSSGVDQPSVIYWVTLWVCTAQ